jgi:hypothetical protein
VRTRGDGVHEGGSEANNLALSLVGCATPADYNHAAAVMMFSRDRSLPACFSTTTRACELLQP